jgi:hypothetical protein
VQRSTARTAAVAILCILALSAAAATLDSSTAVGEGGGPGQPGSFYPESNTTQSTSTPVEQAPDQGPLAETMQNTACIPALRDPLVMVPLIAVIVGGAVLLGRRRDWALSFGMLAILTSGPLFFFWLAVWFTLTGCETPDANAEPSASIQNGSQLPPGGGGAGGQGTAAATPDPSLLMLAVVGVALVAALAVFVRGTGDDVVERHGDDDEGALAQAAAIASIAETAGEAADRIEASGAVDNEVYRAWREMTIDLPVERPASSTPAEFREAAVDAGMARGDVAELTDLFEEVRYGGYEATEDREQRAVEALRRIESAYGGGEGR